ncbi:3-isopropylmalate dehydratase small subunit, partial [Listeria monocytogenes]|nr:3-isopropylmalate dehydratase small subunit [Listeria monocytogenes]
TWKNKFINGLDDIAITFEHIDAIKAYEQKVDSI